ncbi:glycosyl transferase [filamentous cyanobacterium CCT1]|nr:glycosyl transferase [filamentous cyanobacterium CCT1]PSN81104.1 glycosyl transferase [filamentous cyanobacterium CCP4]
MSAKQLREPSLFLGRDLPAKSWLTILFITILLIGIFFRVVNLDKKPVWMDETHTFSVISGYDDLEIVEKLSGQTPIDVETFIEYKYPNPDKNLGDSFYKLYTDVHPPLYFLIARTFVSWFGDSIKVLRSASAFLSILTIVAIYWLCLELFQSSLVAQVASVLFCVSPFQVLYAQEARPYSLFTLVILLSGASLLWAVRAKSRLPWFIYSLSVALGLYSQFFFLFVIFGYFSYVFTIESFRFTKRFRSFLLANLGGFAAFFPWLITVVIHLSNFKDKSSWITNHTLSILGAVRLWSENISLSFVDPRASEYFGFGRFGFYFLIPPIIILVVYSLYFLFTKTSKQIYLFVLTLIASTALPLIAADLILGGNRQIWPRYLVPCFLGVQISVSYLLTTKSFSLDPIHTNLKRRLWTLITVALMTVGIFFSTVIAQADTWWNKYNGGITIQIAELVNQAEDPLVIVNPSPLSSVFYYAFESDVRLLFASDQKLEVAPSQLDGSIFLLNPTDTLKSEFNRLFNMKLLAQFPNSGPVPGKPTELWKAEERFAQ